MLYSQALSKILIQFGPSQGRFLGLHMVAAVSHSPLPYAPRVGISHVYQSLVPLFF